MAAFNRQNPRHHIIIECVGLRLQATLASMDGKTLTDEQTRHAMQSALEEQKLEDNHDLDVSVTLTYPNNRPVFSVIVGGMEAYTLGN